MAKCKTTDCNNFQIRDGYCAKHYIYNNKAKSKTAILRQKFPWHNLYYTNTWKKLRQLHLSSHPLCVECGAVGSDVDHIIDHKGNRDIFYDSSNLQTLCKKCHAKKTFRDAEFYSLPRSNDFIYTLDLVDESECELLKLSEYTGIPVESDSIIKMLQRQNENSFKLSKKVFIIRLYKQISSTLKCRPKLKSNSKDVINVLGEV